MSGRLLSHRGCWIKGFRGNSIDAIEHSVMRGYGFETDIRDFNGEIVICHDPPKNPELGLTEMLSHVASLKPDTTITIALNIKSDGLAKSVNDALAAYPQLDCFVFDMSVPDMRHYFNLGVPTFTRLSEVERSPSWVDRCQGIWLDSFESDWYSLELVNKLLSDRKRVCIVSPELHGRSHIRLWTELRNIWSNPSLMLCTDIPDTALNFFEGKTEVL
jgi:hypothetical protein